MSKQWNRTSDKLLPKLGRVVLLNIEAKDDMPACVVAGYFKRYSDGQYYYVAPGTGVKFGREATYWSDCLGDDFQCPLWRNKTMNNQ